MRNRLILSLLAGLTVSTCMTSAISADTRVEKPLAPGATLVEIHRNLPDGKPLAVYMLRLDRSAKNISFKALKGKDHVIGTAPPRTMGENLKNIDGEVLATINADFYTMDDPFAGVPCGMIVKDGELMCSPYGWPALGFEKDTDPKTALIHLHANLQIGAQNMMISQVNRVREKGSGLAIYTQSFAPSTMNTIAGTDVVVTDLTPALPLKVGVTYSGKISAVQNDAKDDPIPANSVVFSENGSSGDFLKKNATVGSKVSFTVGLDSDWNGVTQALGGWPILIHAGQIQPYDYDEYLTKPRHSRSVVGWNDRYLYVVAIDGHDSGNSSGMDMAEEAAFMQELGCTEAMNMDGGGSTGLAVRGDIVNRPTDGLDRSVSSGWAVVNSAKSGQLSSLQVSPDNVSMLSGSKIQFRVLGADAGGNPVSVDPSDVKWSLEGIEASSSMADPDAKKGASELTGQVKGELGSVDALGVFTAAKVFRAGMITASVGSISTPTTVSIWDKPAHLYVVPAQQTVKPGQVVHYTILATDRTGRPMTVDGALVTWRSEGATIAQDGTLTAPNFGTFKVRAIVAGVHAETKAEVKE